MKTKYQYRITYPDGTVALAMGLEGVAELLGVSTSYAKECFSKGKPLKDCRIEMLQFVYKSVEHMNRVLSGYTSEIEKFKEREEEIRKRNIESMKNRQKDGKSIREEMERQRYIGSWTI